MGRRIKRYVLFPNVKNIDYTPDIGIVTKDGIRVVVEIVKPHQTIDDLSDIITRFSDIGIATLFIMMPNNRLRFSNYSITKVESFLHRLYYGRCYYWYKGLDLTPIHFSPVLSESEGRYSRRSIRYKDPVFGETVNLLDFTPKVNKMGVPGDNNTVYLYMDNLSPWWNYKLQKGTLVG
jgi:hypothetical protein